MKLGSDGQSCWKYRCKLALNVELDLIEKKFFRRSISYALPYPLLQRLCYLRDLFTLFPRCWSRSSTSFFFEESVLSFASIYAIQTKMSMIKLLTKKPASVASFSICDTSQTLFIAERGAPATKCSHWFFMSLMDTLHDRLVAPSFIMFGSAPVFRTALAIFHRRLSCLNVTCASWPFNFSTPSTLEGLAVFLE